MSAAPVSIEARSLVSTGISATDRARTIQMAASWPTNVRATGKWVASAGHRVRSKYKIAAQESDLLFARTDGPRKGGFTDMNTRRFIAIILSAAMSAGLALSQPAAAQDAAIREGPPPGPMRIDPDPRAEQRAYLFAPTGEEMEYTLYVSSKVDPAVPAPLIVALHGMGGDSNFIVRERLIDLAEEGGYVVVGPMGYNEVGWYGSPVIAFGEGGPDPENLAELSELDVLNVIAIATSQYNIDPNRQYLMGHSMGGAGALFLGQKHAERWAAIAAIAPAAFMMQPVQEEILAPMKDVSVPIMITEGAIDTIVPPDSVRSWAAALNRLGMEHEYLELEGLDHGTIIGASMPEIFRFFAVNERSPAPAPAFAPGRPGAPSR